MRTLPALAPYATDVASSPTTSDGIVCAAHASVNTKAATWTTLIASTAQDTAWLAIQVRTNTNSSWCLTDIGIGASSSEVTLIPNLYCSTQVNAALLVHHYLLPVNIPAGSRISGRTQSNVTVASVRVALQCLPPGPAGIGGLSRVEAGGQDTSVSSMTAVDPGAVAHTDIASPVTLIASTGFDYKWVMVCMAFDATAAATSATWLVDLCVGAGGSEVAVVSDMLVSVGSSNDTGSVQWCAPVAIPAGSRLSARARCSIATATVRIMDVAVWGVG